ncbi:unnamed protein product, partial [Rotaria magnacalcarata]
IDFIDSQYVLTSPRSLEACARLNVKPTALLPKKLADISSEKVRYSTLVDVHDEMEIERLAKLQHCREEREKIIQEEELKRPLSTKIVDPKPSYVNDRSTNRKNPIKPKFHPSSASVRNRSNSITSEKPSRSDTHFHRPLRPTSGIRPTVTTLNVKPSIIQWPSSDSQDELRTSSSAGFLDDVRRMDESLQRLGTSSSKKNERYIDGLENVKQIIEQHVTQITSDNDLENLPLDKNQYELLLSHYEHELKIQKARENAR